MTYYESATATMRSKLYDKELKGFAEASYKFKQALSVVSSSAWKNFFYRETSAALTATTPSNIRGIPRGAAFPQVSESWEQVQATMEKYGAEDIIPWEDILSNDIDVRDRTLKRIAEAVAKKVDDTIYSGLTEAGVPTNIQSITLDNGTAWNGSSGNIIKDLLQAKQKMSEYNYDSSNAMAFISPLDYTSIMDYLARKGAQFPTIGADIARNGVVGQVAGVTLVVSNSVTASQAVVVIPKVCGTWKELVPLQTDVSEDKFRKTTIRAVEIGVLELTDPKAVVFIRGTQSS